MRRRTCWLLSSVVIATVCFLTFSAVASAIKASQVPWSGEGVRIHIMNFYDMDAIIIESRGHFMMVDSGEDTDCPDGSDARYPVRPKTADASLGREDQVLDYLRKLGATKGNFDFYIGTHAHSDHIGSADEVIREFEPSRVYTPQYDDSYISNPNGLYDNQYVYDQLCEAAHQVGATLITSLSESASSNPASSGELGGESVGNPSFYFGDAQIQIVNYEEETHPRTAGAFPGTNSYSWGVIVSCDDHRVFLSGDINNLAGDEDRLADVIGHVDVLKLGHHGRKGSNSPSYLEALSPTYAIQTGSRELMSNDKIELLSKIGCRYFSMDDLCDKGSMATVIELSDRGLVVSDAEGNVLT